METKRCGRCTTDKPITDFRPRGGGRRGVQSYCRPCANRSVRESTRRKRREPIDLPKTRGQRWSRPEGATFMHRGYVLEKRTGHHRADRYGWVYQHVLVAEEKYGFLIPVGFTIHHENGVRHDNRPENLDLRVGPHGKGADVLPGILRDPDMRTLAREILSQYDD